MTLGSHMANKQMGRVRSLAGLLSGLWLGVIGWVGPEARGLELAPVGTEIQYSCSAGPSKERSTLIYGK